MDKMEKALGLPCSCKKMCNKSMVQTEHMFEPDLRAGEASSRRNPSGPVNLRRWLRRPWRGAGREHPYILQSPLPHARRRSKKAHRCGDGVQVHGKIPFGAGSISAPNLVLWWNDGSSFSL
jgi:hypothetical protein